jgi:hypothetical protein
MPKHAGLNNAIGQVFVCRARAARSTSCARGAGLRPPRTLAMLDAWFARSSAPAPLSRSRDLARKALARPRKPRAKVAALLREPEGGPSSSARPRPTKREEAGE